mgnify:FL=1
MKKRINIATVLLIASFIIGLSLVLYPSVSNYVNSLHRTKEIAAYAQEVQGLDEEECKRLLDEAREYNASLWEKGTAFSLTEEEKTQYLKMLRIPGTETFGYIEIPSLDVMLPIYHGTQDAVLQRAIGHLEWTSLPVGGESTHSVLSGHRGLPSEKLFTELDKLAEGDVFILRILNETLTYEVDRIRIVEPEDTTDLMIEEGKDLCTLVTCTPYGINTHRLLVRGHRVENREEAKNVPLTSEAVQVEPMVVAPFLAIPLLLIFLLSVLLTGNTGKKD